MVAPPEDTPLEDYALLSDCRSAALVSKHGSIDWWCAPRFDAPACFAALLGNVDNGFWKIAPTAPARSIARRYTPDTMIVELTFETDEGAITLTDFLAFADDDTRPNQLVRIVTGVRGDVPVHMDLALRFDYGSRVPWVTRKGKRLRMIAGPEVAHLYTNAETRGVALRTVSDFRLKQGEQVWFSLTHAPSHLPEQAPHDPYDALSTTNASWRAWSARSKYRGSHRDIVHRSLLTLKALTCRPTGGIIAAPTTSLPEQLGGARNWDYRFCWIRDATITLYALLVTGYVEEAKAWRNWLLRAVAGEPSEAQVIYGLAGERRIQEYEVPWLSGYAGSRPVRVGNAAHTQLQLDVFGELMDAMYQCREAGLANAASWALERQLMQHLESQWRKPDEGIWEIRGPRRQFTHSKVMAWVAFDRAVRTLERFEHDGPLERWRDVRAEIHHDVCTQGYSEERGTFVQSYGGQELDASLLLMPLVGFLPPDDPRIVRTVNAIERELLIDDTFVLRYRTTPDLDGLPPGEGAFLACSFWLVSNRVMQGRIAEAEGLFERLLALCNDVGLLAEEYDPRVRRLVGNFPQAFSHLALVDAAVSLSNVHDNPASHRVDPARTTKAGGKSEQGASP